MVMNFVAMGGDDDELCEDGWRLGCTVRTGGDRNELCEDGWR